MRSLLLCCSVLVLFTPAAYGDTTTRIVGETRYKPHSLVRLKAENVDPKAAILWRIYPSHGVERATSPRGVLEFIAHPGTYEVELLVIRMGADGVLSVEESRVSVTIEGCHPVPPSPPKPDPKPPEKGDGKLDPVNAIGRVRFGSAGCTATVIGPRRPDGRWDVLTAAHCVTGVGARGTLTLKDDRTLGIRVVAYHKGPDVAWCVTDDEVKDLPYALIAAKNPEPGTEIWHMGYGVDRPGNREDGTVAERENDQGQLRMILSVSSGDSGGGIFRKDTNELVSVVCCTSSVGRKVSMWGASAEVLRRTRPKVTDDTDGAWVPVPIPIRPWPIDLTDEAWLPMPIPIRPIFTVK